MLHASSCTTDHTTPPLSSMRAPGGDSLPLLRAMALLYSHQGRYDMALSILLRLRDPGVFAFIRKHGLLPNIAQYVYVYYVYTCTCVSHVSVAFVYTIHGMYDMPI